MRYFSSHGPATLADFTWWTGLRVKEAQQAIAEAGARLAEGDVGRPQLLVGSAAARTALAP